MSRRAPLLASLAVAATLTTLTVLTLLGERAAGAATTPVWRFALLVSILIATLSGLVYLALLGRLLLHELRDDLNVVRAAARETVGLIEENKALAMRYTAAVTDAERTRARFLEKTSDEREHGGDG